MTKRVKRVAMMVVVKGSVSPAVIKEWREAITAAGFIPTVIEYDPKTGYVPTFLTTN